MKRQILLGVAACIPMFAMAAGSDAQPPSGLGKSVGNTTAPQVVYPSIPEIVDDSVSEIEQLQLTPEQIKRLKNIANRRKRAEAMAYNNPPGAVTRTMVVSLDPGVAPPVLRLSKGQLSSLVFSDNAGNPWYIDRVGLNRNAFSDGRTGQSNDDKAPPTNVLTLEPTSPQAYGNVSVMLKGLSTPVIFVLTSGQPTVDMRVDIKVPGRNPDAVDGLADIVVQPALDSAMTYFLDGVPPKSAKRLNVAGMDQVEAWSYSNSLYVRAKAQAQFPAYMSAARSTSGVFVYRFDGMPNAITFLAGGQAVTAFIQQ